MVRAEFEGFEFAISIELDCEELEHCWVVVNDYFTIFT